MTNSDDCNDAADSIGAATSWYSDGDGDGWGSGTPTVACDAPVDFISDGTDCNDDSPSIYPGATDFCGDGIDTDCDGHPTDWGTDCHNLEPQDVLGMFSCTGEPEGFSVAGDFIRVTYGEDGFWWSAEAGAGLEIRPEDRDAGLDDWAEVTHSGTSIDQMSLWAYGVDIDLFFTGGHGEISSDFTLECASPVGMGDVVGAVHSFSALYATGETVWIPWGHDGTGMYVPVMDYLTIERTELWNRGGESMLVHYEVTGSDDDETVPGFILQRNIDPDMDPASGRTTFYENTDEALYVSASGPTSDWTVGWGSCNGKAWVGTIDNLARSRARLHLGWLQLG